MLHLLTLIDSFPLDMGMLDSFPRYSTNQEMAESEPKFGVLPQVDSSTTVIHVF